MMITDVLLVLLAVGLLVVGFLLVRKIRTFHSPPPDKNEELSRRVERLIEESRKKDTHASE